MDVYAWKKAVRYNNLDKLRSLIDDETKRGGETASWRQAFFRVKDGKVGGPPKSSHPSYTTSYHTPNPSKKPKPDLIKWVKNNKKTAILTALVTLGLGYGIDRLLKPKELKMPE